MRPNLVCLLSIMALGLAGCESSARFGNVWGGGSRVASRPMSSPEPIIAAPTPQVESAPLSAPGGVATAPPPGSPDPNAVAGQPDPNAPPVTPPPAPKPVTPRVASAPTEDRAPSGPTRTGVTGNWSVAEAAGGKCRATLSSAPALDLYKASTSGCNSKELQRVTAWELRGNEIYLYESGGAVAARLQQSGNNTFNGADAKSGAPITLSK